MSKKTKANRTSTTRVVRAALENAEEAIEAAVDVLYDYEVAKEAAVLSAAHARHQKVLKELKMSIEKNSGKYSDPKHEKAFNDAHAALANVKVPSDVNVGMRSNSKAPKFQRGVHFTKDGVRFSVLMRVMQDEVIVSLTRTDRDENVKKITRFTTAGGDIDSNKLQRAVQEQVNKLAKEKATSASVVSAAKDEGDKKGDRNRKKTLVKIIKLAEQICKLPDADAIEGLQEVCGSVAQLGELSNKLDDASIALKQAKKGSDDAEEIQQELDSLRSTIDTMLPAIESALSAVEKVAKVAAKSAAEYAKHQSKTDKLKAKADKDAKRLESALSGVKHALKLG